MIIKLISGRWNMEPDLKTVNDYLVSVFNDILTIEESELKKSQFKDLSITEMHTIEAIGMYKKKTTSEVAKELSITVGTLTTAINKLVKKGYVERIRSEDDRRVVKLGLTKKGKLLFRVHQHFHREMVKNILEGMATEEQHALLDALKNLHDFLQDYKNFAGVCLNWVIYTANNHISKPEGLVMQNYTEPTPGEFAANRHIKSIIRPRCVNIMDSSHFARYAGRYYAVNENYKCVERAHSFFSNDVAQINHYFTKSFEEWLGKVGRGLPDSLQTRAVDEFWIYNPGMMPRRSEIEQIYQDTIQKISR